MPLDHNIDDVFERRLIYPDTDARNRLSRLAGVDRQKETLAKILGVLVNKSRLQTWASEHHPAADTLIAWLLRRPPLVILAGDVGTGKTELAESIGDQIARQEEIDLTLFPLSVAARGSGLVGEMTQLIASAFSIVLGEA